MFSVSPTVATALSDDWEHKRACLCSQYRVDADSESCLSSLPVPGLGEASFVTLGARIPTAARALPPLQPELPVTGDQLGAATY